MELLTPGIGLIFWQTVVFLAVVIVLAVFVWKPVSDALRAREGKIEDSLRAAESAKDEMEHIKLDNEYLLQEARTERDEVLKEALAAANRIKEDAKNETSKISEKMISDAKQTIEIEKKAALTEVKDLVSSLSIDIAEKLIREKLGDEQSQKALVNKFLKESKVN